MTEKVVIEIHDDTPPPQLRGSLPSPIGLEHREGTDNERTATVAEGMNAIDEVTNLLNHAGIDASV